MSWAEAKWIVDSLLQKTGQSPNNMRAFSASSLSDSSLGLRFLEPADSYADGNLICAVAGVMIRMSETDYPAGTSEGTLVVDNKVIGRYETDPFVLEGLVSGRTYYFSAFPYSTQGVYNLSSDPANRTEAAPAAGETATVTITIDDPSAFDRVAVTCVDETDPALTASATLTPSQPTASFVVAIGHSYHIEYGAAEGYSQPPATASKVSVAGAVTEYTAAYRYFTATIHADYPAGAVCTCSLGATVYTAGDTSGSWDFSVHEAGIWVVAAASEAESASAEVIITASGQTETVALSFFPAEPTEYVLYSTETASTTFVAPVNGYYQIELHGTSGNGGNAYFYGGDGGSQPSYSYTGASGGGGAYVCSQVKMLAGDTLTITIGNVCTVVIDSSVEGASYDVMQATLAGNGGNASGAIAPSGGAGGVASGGNVTNTNGGAGGNGLYNSSSRPAGGAAGGPGGNVGGQGALPYGGNTATAGKTGFAKIYQGNTNPAA